ncbi:hypothetical protein SAMN05444007_103398 [Cribrihabitans marinus]|uniref:Phage tail tube protein, GTA-gp10 n=1 Tax=Cribrihabitans marinus TaxID=1227549 RepID=A0A1H6WE44_9RHOB|nr:gene transfer agent family protein [Cribrihabitans marinus]GGH24428.1 hypothetical protein GCM10010973_10920 [Cribrihabitans marinus]SEJ13494.1 hypothetical protein SAMN05444007_103398 [Cribrihabitans marinus]
MAKGNRIRGEASVVIEGKTYTIVIDMNAIAGVEDATNSSWALIAGRMANDLGRFSDMRHILHQGLLRNHPDATLTLAGDILSYDDGMEAVSKAIAAAFPQEENSDGESGNAIPAAK